MYKINATKTLAVYHQAVLGKTSSTHKKKYSKYLIVMKRIIPGIVFFSEAPAGSPVGDIMGHQDKS